ncbi:hypothetical protein PSAB6_460008 [Paraburkholderia sabiae]|nr:hypothetical protein PSAB6_460008 [Paraburkholderia sabiae]
MLGGAGKAVVSTCGLESKSARNVLAQTFWRKGLDTAWEGEASSSFSTLFRAGAMLQHETALWTSIRRSVKHSLSLSPGNAGLFA